ncbi:MAG: T9SS type A sorting domain-containing protein [Crocinitomicaceae bacterium]
MKSKIRFNAILLTAIASGLLIASCGNHKKIQPVLNSRAPQPNDYWSMKRSHPVYGFDQKAYFNGMEAVAKIKNDQAKDGPNLNLNWQFEGPNNIQGRVNVVTPVSRASDTIFAGSVNGGIFRTINGGNTWTPLFQDFGYLAIGSITVDPSDHNTIYAGTGDRNFGGYSYNGNGLYKSTDLGATWTQIGLGNVGIITSCVVNASNPSTIVVGALGSGFEKTNDRGIYRTTDGGATWTNTLFVSDSSGVCEMRVHPTNPAILYATTFNRLNLSNRSISKGLDSKIFKSIDGGATWSQLTNGLPTTTLSRCGIAISESNPNKLYAIFIGDDYNIYDIYKSEDAGSTWTALNIPLSTLPVDAVGGFGWYFGRIHVNPFNENHIIVPGVDQYESTDGGLNWNMNVPNWWTYEVHADKHDLYFKDANTIVIATDGGMYKTTNLGISWSTFGELPITQFYRVNANTFDPNNYAGGAQDNGTTSGNNGTLWNRDFGGDGFQSYYIDPSNDITTFETQRGGIYWSQFGFADDISIGNSLSDRTNWSTPYFSFPDYRLTAGSYRVLKMENPPFDSWVPISGDLTRIGLGATTSPNYSTLSEINYNSFDQNELIVGTSDGLVWKGNRSTGNFTNISGSLPYKFVSSVNYSKKINGKIYVTQTGYYNNFSQALVFKSEDAGATWIDISSNLPAIGINTMITHYVGGVEALIVGTDAGVFFSNNDGVSWTLLGNNLPIITISALDINTNNNRLIAGTFGRSMWSYDFTWELGIEELNESDQMIYPNPGKEFIRLKNDEDFIEILTLDGQLIRHIKNPMADQKIDVHDLEGGLYLVRTKTAVIRFIKE